MFSLVLERKPISKIAINFPISSLVEISENKLVAAEELCVENILLKETPSAAILFDDAVDKERNHFSTGRLLVQNLL